MSNAVSQIPMAVAAASTLVASCTGFERAKGDPLRILGPVGGGSDAAANPLSPNGITAAAIHYFSIIGIRTRNTVLPSPDSALTEP